MLAKAISTGKRSKWWTAGKKQFQGGSILTAEMLVLKQLQGGSVLTDEMLVKKPFQGANILTAEMLAK